MSGEYDTFYLELILKRQTIQLTTTTYLQQKRVDTQYALVL